MKVRINSVNLCLNRFHEIYRYNFFEKKKLVNAVTQLFCMKLLTIFVTSKSRVF